MGRARRTAPSAKFNGLGCDLIDRINLDDLVGNIQRMAPIESTTESNQNTVGSTSNVTPDTLTNTYCCTNCDGNSKTNSKTNLKSIHKKFFEISGEICIDECDES